MSMLAQPKSETAFLALGSNIGDKCANLASALARLDAVPGLRVIKASQAYRTPPWGKTNQDWFANAVVMVESSLAPEALLEAVLAVERAMGRERLERWGPRVIDIDVLLQGDAHRNSETLTLPHPAMLARAFVLVPLAEVAPDLVIAGATVAEHLAVLDREGIAPLGALVHPVALLA